MQETTSTEDIIFDNSYTSTKENLIERIKKNLISREGVNAELDSLYKYEGLDWIGRGEIKNMSIQGSIAAYQVVLNRWDEWMQNK